MGGERALRWIRILVDVPDHPKILRFARLAEIDRTTALGALVRLWAWAARHRPESGDLSDLDDGDIADVMSLDIRDLRSSLVSSGLLDEAGRINGWEEYHGRALAERARKRRGPSADAPRKLRGNGAETPSPQSKRKRERKKEEEEDGGAAREYAPTPPIPLADGSEYRVSREDYDRWRTLFPGVDVDRELRRAAAWNHANPKRRKTRRGVRAHLTSWLAKAQDRPASAGGARSGPARPPDPGLPRGGPPSPPPADLLAEIREREARRERLSGLISGSRTVARLEEGPGRDAALRSLVELARKEGIEAETTYGIRAAAESLLRALTDGRSPEKTEAAK